MGISHKSNWVAFHHPHKMCEIEGFKSGNSKFAMVAPFVGKKVEVSLRLFDIFEKNMVFIFLLGSLGTHPADCTLGRN